MARRIKHDSQKQIKQSLRFMEELNMGKFSITEGPISKPVKLVIYGSEGIGKSTLASKSPDPIVIDTEDSTSQLNVKRYPKPADWEELLEMVKEVAQEQPCKTLIVDSLDWAERMCATYVCAKAKKVNIEDFGFGKGYQYLTDEFSKLLAALDVVVSSGINVVLVAHAMMRKFEQPDEAGAYDRWELKLTKKTAPVVKEWADCLLFANYKTSVVDVDGTKKARGGKRVLYTTHSPCWDAKNRFQLPEELPLDYEGIKHIFFIDKRPNSAAKVLKTASELGIPFDIIDNFPDEFEGVNPELAQAIKSRGLTIRQIQSVVSQKGWASPDTPLSAYEDGLVNSLISNIDKIKTIVSLM